MGTSKGYISPSTPKWVSAKRRVSAYISSPSVSKKKEVAARYAQAMSDNNSLYKRATAVFSNFASFVLQGQSNGFDRVLNDYQLNQIIDLPPEEALSELINAFSDGSTIDDDLACLCIYSALEELSINTLDDLSNLDVNILIKEFVCQFSMLKFAQLFDKHIKSKCDNIAVANARMQDIQEYIYNELMEKLTLERINAINPLNLANEQLVNNIMQEAFNILEHYYDE